MRPGASLGLLRHRVAAEVKHMERNRKDREGGVLSTVAELFDLPADVVAGLPRLEMIGSRQLYLEHHTGILAYSQDQVDANTSAGVLRIRGADLTLLAMTAGGLRSGGRVGAVEWRGGDSGTDTTTAFGDRCASGWSAPSRSGC